jgi:pullulanase/glycogen debranching enzyme
VRRRQRRRKRWTKRPARSDGPSDGVNFCVFSRSAVAIELLLFDGDNDERLTRVIQLDAATHRTYHYWHVFVAGLRAGQLYGYRVYVPLIRPTACDSIPTSYS